MNAPLPPLPVPESVTPATVGATVSGGAAASVPLPSTTKFASSPTACPPRPSVAALPPSSAIVPPFSASAEAPMPIPFGSLSAETTV